MFPVLLNIFLVVNNLTNNLSVIALTMSNKVIVLVLRNRLSIY